MTTHSREHLFVDATCDCSALLAGTLIDEGGQVKREKILLTSKDASRILDCSPDDMYALVRRGELKAVKVGRFWGYRPEDVEAYVKKVNKPEVRCRQTKAGPRPPG